MFKKEKEQPKTVQEVKADVKLPDHKADEKAAQPNAAVEPKAKTDGKSQGLSQREAVYLAVMQVFTAKNVKLAGSKASDLLTPEMRVQIIESLCSDFRAGKISLRQTPANQSKLSDDKELRVYTIGLVNNWLRRDKRLNGTGQ